MTKVLIFLLIISVPPKFHDFRNVNFGVSAKDVIKNEEALSGGKLLEKKIENGTGYLIYLQYNGEKKYFIKYLFYKDQFYKGEKKIQKDATLNSKGSVINDYNEMKWYYTEHIGKPFKVEEDSLNMRCIWIYNSDASSNYKIKLEMSIIKEDERYYRKEEYSPYL